MWRLGLKVKGAVRVLTIEENVEPIEDGKAESKAARVRRWYEDETGPCPFEDAGEG